MAEYTFGGPSYLTISQELPPAPASDYPTVLTAFPMSEIPEKVTSSAPRSSRSGPHSPNLTSLSRSMRYNSIGGVPSVVQSGRYGGTSPAHNRAASRALRRLQEMRRPQTGPGQRRRDELRASYHRLKSAVPRHGLSTVPHPRPSKIALLDRAATRIDSLEKSRQELLAKIREVEEEATRLRQANVELALGVVGQPPAVASTPP